MVQAGYRGPVEKSECKIRGRGTYGMFRFRAGKHRSKFVYSTRRAALAAHASWKKAHPSLQERTRKAKKALNKAFQRTGGRKENKKKGRARNAVEGIFMDKLRAEFGCYV